MIYPSPQMRNIVKDSRVGELLWKEWTGDGFDPQLDESIVFFTDEHVDLENELIRRALASALQRDGISISLGNGFQFAGQCTFWQVQNQLDGLGRRNFQRPSRCSPV